MPTDDTYDNDPAHVNASGQKIGVLLDAGGFNVGEGSQGTQFTPH